MRLQSITLHGFKSFADRTAVKVLPGVTAIVGPNGCGKCLVGTTPVMLADGRVVPIGALVETELEQAPLLRRFDDGIAALNGGRGIEVLSLDPATLRLEPRPVEAFIRRSAPSFLLRVRTRSGREVVTTHYHPFFTLDGGDVKVLTADDLARGIRIAVPRCLPVKAVAQATLSEALLSSVAPKDRLYAPHSPRLQDWLVKASDRAGGWSRLATRTGLPEHSLSNVMAGQAVRVGVVARVAAALDILPPPIDRLASSRGATIRLPQEPDGRLARFLGYLIAEGRTTRSNQVWFVNSDPAVTAEFARLAREVFEVEPRELQYKAGTTDTLIFSRTLCLFLERVCGIGVDSGSAAKAVPPPILTASDEVVGEFLSGLFEGDAFIHAATSKAGSAMAYVEYVTASRRLAEDVCTLLLRLGIFPLMRPRVRCATNTLARRRKTYYGVYVYGVEQIRRLAAYVRFVGVKQKRLRDALALEAKSNPNLDLIPGATALVRAAVAAGDLPVKSNRRLHPKLAAYVEGRCEASRAGLHEVASLVERHGGSADAATPVVRQLRALADSDVYWDQVVAIERTAPPDPWVYDLTVADTHNFVAGNMIVHNSNISESVRWALGEQSAKALRGGRMEDLIFHGSPSRKPVGLAEVELLFENGGTLAVPWSEITVSRRLYRTGESEYLLNKAPCRLRDILDLFAGTGANPRAYSVMDQDKLNHVLTAKPHERRIFIEEAAGIARYKQQRNETQGKLDAARQNLVRVRDVMEEVRRQLGSLERQARKAQQYKALQAEKRDLALALVAADHAALTLRRERLAGEITALRDDEQRIRAECAALAAREARQREALQASEHRLGDLRQATQKVQGDLERLLERREQMGGQLAELAEEAVRLEEEVRATTERLAALGGERETARLGLAEAEGLCAERVARAERLDAEVERHRAALGAERDRLEALRLAGTRAVAERVDLMRHAGELRERATQLGQRRARLGAELAQVEAEAARLAELRVSLEAARDRTVAELTRLEAEREQLAGILAEREQRRETAEARLAEARLELAARSSSFEALGELDRQREGYAAGVRAVFSANGVSRLAGVRGTVADLLEVPPGLERAIEAVLGERLQWVVVDRFEDARTAVAYLREERAGSATFLPLETLPPATAMPSDNGVRWAARTVTGPATKLVEYLLGRVAIVEHLDQAEALWRNNGVVATYVTPAGEVLGPTGRLRGGAEAEPAAAERSLLARKRRLRELEDDLGRLAAEVAESERVVGALASETAGLRATIDATGESLQALAAARLAGEKDLEQSLREHERLGRHRETIHLELGQVDGEGEETRALLARLDQRITAALEAETRHETAVSRLREAIEEAQETETRLRGELTACRIELASARERVEALGRELGRLDEMELELTERIAQARGRGAQLDQRRAWLAEERNRTDLTARDVAAERDRLEGEVRRSAERHEALATDLRTIEGEARARDAELSRLTAAVHERELAATETRVRGEEMAQEAWRVYGVDAATLAAHHDAARDLEAARQRVDELEARLAAIGAVNLVADEEYQELDERLTFLRTQHDDLVSSIKDLDKALRGMTRAAQERFNQAFHEINGHFARIFERLFEGGRAELRLVESEEGEDPLDTGVELMAQPRGKRLQAVTLLSGGERALTGLALLFAMFYYRPSPFCVLDEVDAPLDDANIHRFLRVLRELTSQTQFLVITHNRKTMEAADALYGVTMEEPGLSSLVSVNLGG